MSSSLSGTSCLRAPNPGLASRRLVTLTYSGGWRHAIEQLLPGAAKELEAADARRIPLTTGMVSLSPQGWYRRWSESHYAITCSRDLLDWVIRQRVLREAGARITVMERTSVRGLTGTSAKVTGVSVRCEDTGKEDTLLADLVVDASGRASHTPRWLTALGVQAATVRQVDSGLVYASRFYRAPDGLPEDWPHHQCPGQPPVRRTGSGRCHHACRRRPLARHPLRHSWRRTYQGRGRVSALRPRAAAPHHWRADQQGDAARSHQCDAHDGKSASLLREGFVAEQSAGHQRRHRLLQPDLWTRHVRRRSGRCYFSATRSSDTARVLHLARRVQKAIAKPVSTAWTFATGRRTCSTRGGRPLRTNRRRTPRSDIRRPSQLQLLAQAPWREPSLT